MSEAELRSLMGPKGDSVMILCLHGSSNPPSAVVYWRKLR